MLAKQSPKPVVSLAALVMLSTALACGSAERGDEFGGDGSPDGGGGASDSDDDDGGAGDGDAKFDVHNGDGSGNGGDQDGDCEGGAPPTDATLKGTVYTPNLEIPISGALVYTASERPEGIPDGVYCAQCQPVECHHHHTFSEPDGSFELPAFSGPGQHVVVIKGEFMHITQMNIGTGETTLDPVVSSLPGEWNPDEGHYIPRMAVMQIEDDKIYNVLAKIGLAEVDAGGNMVPGTEQFDIYGESYFTENLEGQALLENLDQMNRYHIIFIPCQAQGPLSPGGYEFETGNVSQRRTDNIREWAEAGGRWYVTDWANEYMFAPFPVYQTFYNPSSPDINYYDSEATVLDPDLLAWLEALPAPLKDIGAGLPTLLNLPSVTLEDNWSGLDEIPEVIVQDDEGQDINVGHYPWVEGPCEACNPGHVRPMTVTGRYGCGRLLFSTYHTNQRGHVGLTPQELMLLYIILEIGVCDENPPPPIPPQG